MKGIYKYSYNDVYGSICGVFEADTEVINFIKDHNIGFYMNDYLGKYSEIEAEFDEMNFQLLTKDPEKVASLEAMDVFVGPNPMNFQALLDNELIEKDEEFDYYYVGEYAVEQMNK